MKIETKRGYVAILKEQRGGVVGVFMPSIDARGCMETAVCMHFDVATCGLVSDRDFTQPLDYNQEYTFVLYNGDGGDNRDDEYVTLFMTYAPLFTEVRYHL